MYFTNENKKYPNIISNNKLKIEGILKENDFCMTFIS